MSEVVHLSAEKFDEVTSQGLCLVDFWAPWCGPCKMLSPILDQVAAEVGDKILIAKANVDELPGQCVKFGVRNVPEILILRDGLPENIFKVAFIFILAVTTLACDKVIELFIKFVHAGA